MTVACDDDNDIVAEKRDRPLSFSQRSVFAQLTTEIEEFSKMVGKLESLLNSCGSTPENAWRMRILLKSAVETDQDVYRKLFQYEKSLHNTDRTAQTACLKLHRDFKRSHKGLLLAVSLYERKQKVEMSQLGAVGWTEKGTTDEDFYDRALRQREEEIQKINKDMHTVNDLYSELAQMVDDQQDEVNRLEDNTREANQNVQDGLFCLFHQDYLPSCGSTTSLGGFPSYNKNDSEWMKKAWQNLMEDMKAIRQDIVELGNDFVSLSTPDSKTITSNTKEDSRL